MRSTLGRDAHRSEDLTCDAFLGGRLHLWQPRQGLSRRHRSGPAGGRGSGAGRAVGAGSGMWGRCGGAVPPGRRVPGLSADRGRTSDRSMPIWRAATPRKTDCRWRSQRRRYWRSAARHPRRRFDHVMANPPYYRPEARSPASDPGRAGGPGREDAAARMD